MSKLTVISPDKKNLNKIEFDLITNKMHGIINILSKMKHELIATYGKFISMLEIIQTFTDYITQNEKQLYDVQCQALLHSLHMYVSIKDENEHPYINPASDTNETTVINLTVNFPSYTITRALLNIDNISIDLSEWDIRVGSMIVNLRKSDELLDTLCKDDFINGVIGELEKILLVTSQICRLEQLVNANNKYITELKNIGLYN